MENIRINIYRSEIELYIGKSKNNGSKIIERYGRKKFIEKYSSGFCFAICFLDSKGKMRFVISLDKKAKREEIYHESLHMSFYILESVLIKFDNDNHEALCYLQGYIAEKIIKQLKKQK